MTTTRPSSLSALTWAEDLPPVTAPKKGQRGYGRSRFARVWSARGAALLAWIRHTGLLLAVSCLLVTVSAMAATEWLHLTHVVLQSPVVIRPGNGTLGVIFQGVTRAQQVTCSPIR